MPANEYYDSSGVPSPNSALNTRIFNTEFNAIEAGFDKLPPLSGYQGNLVMINSGGSLIRTISPDNLSTDLDIELTTNRDIANGHAGLSLRKLKLKNQLNTFASLLQNTATAERTWTLPDVSGELIDSADTAPYAPIDSPVLTGIPTVPSPTNLDSASLQIITTAFMRDAMESSYGSYFYFQDNILIQYGNILSHATPLSAVYATLPITYDNASFFVFGAVHQTIGDTKASSSDASHVEIKCSLPETSVFWMTIGQKAR